MMKNKIQNTEIIEQTLNDLLIKCNDAKEGFLKAAGLVNDLHLRDLLVNKADQRLQFASDIENEILAMGAKVNSTTSILSSVHRVWMEIQSTFSSDARAIISECLRGEYAAIKDYSDASVTEGLPGSTRAMIMRQREAVRKSIGELRQWHAQVQEEVTA
jgi:uncharacterized protein (TIGR02284 family)